MQSSFKLLLLSLRFQVKLKVNAALLIHYTEAKTAVNHRTSRYSLSNTQIVI